MFLSPPMQLIPFYGLAVVLGSKLKNEILYNVAHLLVSFYVLANSMVFYVFVSLMTGKWTASTNGISPLRWLAALALPVLLASRALQNKIVTSSGAIAVVQIGFVLTLANLSFTMSFGAYLIWFELHRSATYEPKTYLNIICELGLGVHLAFLHLLEVDQFGPEGPLDFRNNYLQTWLAVSLIGSLSLSVGDTFYLTTFQSCMKGSIIGAAYFLGVIISGSGLSSLHQMKPFAQAPNQMHIIGLGMAGGLFGASWTPALRALLWPGLRTSDPLPPKGHHYGLSLLTSIVSGLLLPRFAITMDTGKFIYWDNLAKLSSD